MAGYGTHHRDVKSWIIALLTALSLMMAVVTIGLLAHFLVFGKVQLGLSLWHIEQCEMTFYHTLTVILKLQLQFIPMTKDPH